MASSTLEQAVEQGTSISGRYYKLDVVGMSGQGLIAAVNPDNPSLQVITDAPSINDQGRVAFSAKVSSTVENIFIDNGSTSLSPISPINRRYGSGVRINSSGHVAAQDVLSAAYVERIWTAPDTNTIVERSATRYSYLGTWPAFNDSGQMAFNAVRTTGNNVLITKDSTTHELAVNWSVRPALANDGRVVFNEDLLTGPISLLPYDLSSKETIADSSCFSKLGRFAAISPDGRIIVFYGETTPSCAHLSAVEQDTPVGVFASLQLNGGGRKLVRLSGLRLEVLQNDSSGNKDGKCSFGESCKSSELGFDLDGSSHRFDSYDFNSRIAVAHQPLGAPGIVDDSFVVSFVATPFAAHSMGIFTDKKGIWTVRADVTGSDANPLVTTSVPMPVIQVGDSIGGEIVSEFSSDNGPAYPEIANARTDLVGKPREQRRGDHRVVFYAKTNSGQFLVVRGEHLDSDEDALADHWESKGIDFNQDGTIDLDLPALYRTNPFLKDLIVELDYMKDTAHSHMPHPRRLKAVHDAFAAHGIRLHHFIDDAVAESLDIAFLLNAPLRKDIVLPGPVKYFSDYKYGNVQNLCATASLGRAEERGLANCLNILRARNISTRYALFGHRLAQFTGGASGVAERNGNDLLMTIFEKDPATNPGTAAAFKTSMGDGRSCTSDDDVGADGGLKCGMNEILAGTYMHELGHTLGLGHGGSDDQSCKPNYLSVMNYFYQTRGFNGSRKLDYSDSVLAPLDERAVDEKKGVSFPLSIIFWGHWGHTPSSDLANMPVINWDDSYNTDGIPTINDNTYPLDLNWFDPIGCHDRQKTLLEGHDDWSHLKFDFRRNSEGNLSMAGADLSEGELVLESLGSVVATLDPDGDGVSNADDNCIMVANPGQEDLNHNGQGDACELRFAPVDLSASITASPSPVRVGANLTFTLTLTNRSTFPESQVTVFQELPANADFISVSSAQGQCRRNGLAVGCDLGGLNGNASTTVSVVVRPTGIGTVATAAEVSGMQQDPSEQNNSTTSSVNVDP